MVGGLGRGRADVGLATHCLVRRAFDRQRSGRGDMTSGRSPPSPPRGGENSIRPKSPLSERPLKQPAQGC
eukprot:8382957-Pyramimonas_sp.AAC.1